LSAERSSGDPAPVFLAPNSTGLVGTSVDSSLFDIWSADPLTISIPASAARSRISGDMAPVFMMIGMCGAIFRAFRASFKPSTPVNGVQL